MTEISLWQTDRQTDRQRQRHRHKLLSMHRNTDRHSDILYVDGFCQQFALCSQYIALQPTILLSGGIVIPDDQLAGKVDFKNVTFTYPNRPGQVR